MTAYGQREATVRRRLPYSRLYVHVPVHIRRRASLPPYLSVYVCYCALQFFQLVLFFCLFVFLLSLFEGEA